METHILNYWTQFQDDNYSKTVERELNTERNDTVIEIFKKFTPDVSTVAEIGTGSGALIADLKRLPHGYTVCGLDLPKVISECKKRYPDIEFIEFDAEKDILAPVDVIIASEIIEHLADDFGFLQRCKMSTNHIILTIPTSNYIGENDHHVRAYSKHSMKKLLAIAGFEVIHYHEAAGSQYFYARQYASAMEAKL